MNPRKLALPLGLVVAFGLGSFMTWVIMQGSMEPSAPVEPKPAPAAAAAPAKTPTVAGKSGTANSSTPEEAPAKPAPAPVRVVLQPQAKELPQIVDLLRTDYVDAPKLVGSEIDAKKVEEIFNDPASGIRILAQDPPDGKNARILSELLPGKILYWQVPVFAKQEIDTLAAQWEQIKAQSPVGLVLDLRETRAPQDFAGAADLAALFAPPDTMLFSVQGLKIPQQVLQAGRQPLDFGNPFPIVVVVNSETRGAAEVLAELLRTRAGAVVVGSTTAGEGNPSNDVRLKSGRLLRVATGKVLAPSGQEILVGSVIPDVEVAVPLDDERRAMAAGQSGVAATVAELPLRKRQSEHSLMNDENPEYDEILEEQKAKDAPKSKGAPHDVTLHRAMDVLQGVRIYVQPPATTAKAGPK